MSDLLGYAEQVAVGRMCRKRFVVAIVLSFVCMPGLVTAVRSAIPEPYVPAAQASTPVQLAPREENEWYERGIWPLVGAVGALIITNAVSVYIVYLQSAKSFNAILRQRKIEFFSSSLNEFYNPLLALIDINGEIFTKTGPPSFPKGEIERNAAALVWKETKEKILANNRQIEAILKTKTHLLYDTDSLDAYKSLMVHVAMYETFQKIETDRYRDFLFPKEVRDHIVKKRSAALKVFHKLSGEQI